MGNDIKQPNWICTLGLGIAASALLLACRNATPPGASLPASGTIVETAPVATTAGPTIEHLYDIPVTGDAITMTMRQDNLARPFLYVAAKDGGLLIYDTSGTPALVRTIPAVDLGSLHVMSLSQSGQRLFLALGNHWSGQNPGLAIIDISDPRQATLLGLWRDGAVLGGAGGVEVVDDIAYLGAMKSGLYILDIAVPSSIRQVAKFVPDIRYPDHNPDPPKFNARGMVVRDGIVYLCYDAGGLRLIDVHNPAQPAEIGRYANPSMDRKPRAYNNIVLDGRYAYVTVDYVGFEVLDIASPSAIKLVSWWNPWNPELNGLRWFTSPGHANEIAYDAQRKLVFISAGRSDLQVLSVADPVKPRLVGGYGEVEDKLGTWGVSIHGDRVYLAYIRTLGIPFVSQWTGVKVLRYR